MVLRLKQINHLTQERHQILDDVYIAQLLALFVSDHFGGSDRSAMVEKTRRAVSGSKYQKPFVCTCSTGDRDNLTMSTKLTVDSYEDILFTDICEKSLRAIKASRNSIIVPLGALQFGVCRHRALLLKVNMLLITLAFPSLFLCVISIITDFILLGLNKALITFSICVIAWSLQYLVSL